MPSFPISSKLISFLTGGVETYAPGVSAVVSSGMVTEAGPAVPRPNQFEQVSSPPAGQQSGAPTTTDIQLLDGAGKPVAIGKAFNPVAALLPSFHGSSLLAPGVPGNGLYGQTSYTGSDLKVMIEVANTGQASGVETSELQSSRRLARQLLELTTITVSVHRVKTPARAMGYINPKGFARGTRTIAGTMVLTQMTTDVLYEFLQAQGAFTSDLSKDSAYTKVDQLPPFNLTFLFSDEYGNSSYRRLLGLEYVTSGDVYSIQDMMSEQTVSYVAADFTPLLPLNQSSLNSTLSSSPVTATHRTVSSLLKGLNRNA